MMTVFLPVSKFSFAPLQSTLRLMFALVFHDDAQIKMHCAQSLFRFLPPNLPIETFVFSLFYAQHTDYIIYFDKGVKLWSPVFFLLFFFKKKGKKEYRSLEHSTSFKISLQQSLTSFRNLLPFLSAITLTIIRTWKEINLCSEKKEGWVQPPESSVHLELNYMFFFYCYKEIMALYITEETTEMSSSSSFCSDPLPSLFVEEI